MTKSKLTSALILNKLEDRNTLSPNPLLIYSANMNDDGNADRWLATLSSSIVH